ncbi:FHA domain-containing protein [Planctomicrobium piriforme]|uniref:FHA domain-containing protein n=1 Tax=Planctomicrobium piriforme TaxID=1576369 RepID=A0A1I3AT30_9PLAN|nr:FHA domain-containing protein [Planctomicrobium piriforme]SFH52889.1 FHA domain-containing protein [Planctomicrobium piriforme]
MRQAELYVASGKQMGAVIPLPDGKFLIGREEDCHLRPNSDLVSRHHCVFTVDDFTVRIRDLGSTNGTLVNGERIRGGVILNSGDVVSIGKIEFRVVIKDPSQDTATHMSFETDTRFAQPVEKEKVEELSASDLDIDSLQIDAVGSSAEIPIGGTMTEIPVLDLPAPVPAGATIFQSPPTGDTQFSNPMGMPLPPTLGYPQMPQMPPMPMGYPQMMPYGYPGGYPGMYGQPMGYGMPQGYPQMPMQMPMAPQMPAPMAPPAPEPVAAEPELSPAMAGALMPLKLPEPSETGAKAPAPKPVAPPANGETKTADAKNKEEAPRRAEDIIQQYLKRRPTTDGK